MTPVGTLYRRSLRRVERRAATYTATRSDDAARLLREAVRITNILAHMLPRKGGRP